MNVFLSGMILSLPMVFLQRYPRTCGVEFERGDKNDSQLILIGKCVWIASKVSILKVTCLPDDSAVGFND